MYLGLYHTISADSSENKQQKKVMFGRHPGAEIDISFCFSKMKWFMWCNTSKFHLRLINVLNLKITIKAISVVTQGKKTYKIHLSHWNWNTTSLVQWASVRKQAETSSCHRWPDRGFFKLSMSGVTVSFVQYMLNCTHLAPSGAPIEPSHALLHYLSSLMGLILNPI